MSNRLYYFRVFFLQYRPYFISGMILLMLGIGGTAFMMMNRHRPPVTEQEYKESLKTGRALFDAKRYAEAYEYLIYPARQGYAEANLLLGKMYYNGWGAEKELKLAWDNFEKAAGSGLVEAKYMQASMAFRGEHKKLKPGQATEMLAEAAYQGYAKAQYDLGLYSLLSGEYEQAYFWLSLGNKEQDKKGREALAKAAEKVSEKERVLLDSEIKGFVPRK